MREREPLLFDKMVGRFLPEAEQIYLRPTVENESFSGVLMQFEDSQIISDRRTAHLNEWNDFFKVINHGFYHFWSSIVFSQSDYWTHYSIHAMN